MKRLRISCLHAVWVFLTLILVPGCGKESRIESHLTRAEEYFQKGQFEEAEIEYKNVLRLAPESAAAAGRIGWIYHDQGRLVPALMLLQRAKELNPTDWQTRLKLGYTLSAGRKWDAARQEAVFALDHQPTNEEALLLLANTAVGTNAIAEVLQHLDRLKPQSERSSGYQLALGTLYYRQQMIPEAEAAFERARVIDPKSAAAHLALGDLNWRRDNLPEAERFLKVAKDLAGARSNRPLRYVLFKLAAGETNEAKVVLNEITERTPDYLPAWAKLAEIAFAEKNFEECRAILGKILASDGMNVDGLALSAQLHLLQREPKEALADLDKVNQIFPGIPRILYGMGMAHLMNQDLSAAQGYLDQAVAKDPELTEAVLMKSQLDLGQGKQTDAILALKRLIESQPRDSRAHLLLASAYVDQRNYENALSVYRRLQPLEPQNPRIPYLMGLVLLQDNKNAEARKAFNAALALAPGYALAVEKVVELDIADKDYQAALDRIQTHVDAKDMPEVDLTVLQGKVFWAQQDYVRAEAAAKKVLELAPESEGANSLLTQVYIAAQKHQEALARLESAVETNPKNKGAWYQIGLIKEGLNRYTEARDAYEKVIELDPNFVPALNNLAYLYSVRLDNLDRAYELARHAAKIVPDNPNSKDLLPFAVADTLGWIHFQRGEYDRALAVLSKSGLRLSESSEAQYHLGMAHYMTGDEARARDLLERAQGSNTEFPGRDQIAQRMLWLSLNPESATAEQVSALQTAHQSTPGDPVIAARLASLLEKDTQWKQADDVYQSALQANSQHVPLLVRRAELLALRLGNRTEALALAKRARELAPQDPHIAYTLGQLAFQAGDTQWALSLLLEAARQRPDNVSVLFTLAWAQYTQGQVDAARASMEKVLQAQADFPQAEAVRQFLRMIAAVQRPDQISPVAEEIRQVALNDPDFVPGLFASGMLFEHEGKYAEARGVYERILAMAGYGGFHPALLRLAIVLVDHLEDYEVGYARALAAREHYPRDPVLAKALGVATYQRKDFARSAQLLTEAVRGLASDGEAHFFLGMAQHQLKQDTESKLSLTKALELSPTAAFAEEARRQLGQ